MAAVLTPVQTKQIRINIHKETIQKHSTNSTKHSKYKYTYVLLRMLEGTVIVSFGVYLVLWLF